MSRRRIGWPLPKSSGVWPHWSEGTRAPPSSRNSAVFHGAGTTGGSRNASARAPVSYSFMALRIAGNRDVAWSPCSPTGAMSSRRCRVVRPPNDCGRERRSSPRRSDVLPADSSRRPGDRGPPPPSGYSKPASISTSGFRPCGAPMDAVVFWRRIRGIGAGSQVWGISGGFSAESPRPVARRFRALPFILQTWSEGICLAGSKSSSAFWQQEEDRCLPMRFSA